MSENEKGRNIRFPLELWDAIDEDAKRCKRSAVKQMESVLSLYYRLNAAEVRKDIIEKMQIDAGILDKIPSPTNDAEYVGKAKHAELVDAKDIKKLPKQKTG